MLSVRARRRALVATSILGLVAAVAGLPGCTVEQQPAPETPGLRDATAVSAGRRADAPQATRRLTVEVGPMRKVVSEQATFVAYVPDGWSALEQQQQDSRRVTVSDPSGRFVATLQYGTNPARGDVVALARLLLARLGARSADLALQGAFLTRDGTRLMVDGTFTDPQTGQREFRCWFSIAGRDFSYSTIEAPAGQLAEARPVLLTILRNIRPMKGADEHTAAAPERGPSFAPLAARRLRDGSAMIELPQDWGLQELGRGSFVAGDPSGRFTVLVATVDVLSPAMGVSVPGTTVASFVPPSQGFKLLAERQGLLANLQFERVTPRDDVARQLATVYTVGPIVAEEFEYTFDGRAGPSRGYSFGVSLGSRLNTGWQLWHMTAGGPANEFRQALPSLAACLLSYRIDDEYAQQYIQQGLARLRQLQQQTAQMVAQNARDIRAMMQAAYDERQRSQDYIDYQRTNYIRGEQDWISAVEGGTVYHTDSWGTKNTVTGEFWGEKPYDYVNFTGDNPKYREQMTPVNTRQLWEAAIRPR